ncbi:MAG: class II histone deacetylase, partial [Arenibacterium sp.]
AVEAARHKHGALKVAVLDWDVHHGNGTEGIYYERDDTLTISLHQERNYPIDTGDVADRGAGAGTGLNINVPLPAGTGHIGYLAAMDRIVLPALERFRPDLIVVACGFDGSALDPLAQMLMTPETFRALTERVMSAADSLCGGRLVLVHEGGYSEIYVPFCGHATIATLAGSTIDAPDPLAVNIAARQPSKAVETFQLGLIDEMALALLAQ